MTNAVQYEINQYFDVCLHNSVFYNIVDHVKSMLTYCFWLWRHPIRAVCIKYPTSAQLDKLSVSPLLFLSSNHVNYHLGANLHKLHF
jgi:hypothetical protein